ncbi:Hypothetical protein AJF4211_001130 [Avibacterium paragallinarum JF4211]|nr:Hypothetical protein AJF4211_001130 [Avibacterium paragallinarum JF4211]
MHKNFLILNVFTALFKRIKRFFAMRVISYAPKLK